MTYLSKDDDSEIEMRETESGIAISLRMIEDGLETAGTTFYLRPEQVAGMARWLSERSARPWPAIVSAARDAARYRWLRDRDCCQDGTSESCYLDLAARDLDAAIDAALDASRCEPSASK